MPHRTEMHTTVVIISLYSSWSRAYKDITWP